MQLFNKGKAPLQKSTASAAEMSDDLAYTFVFPLLVTDPNRCLILIVLSVKMKIVMQKRIYYNNIYILIYIYI